MLQDAPETIERLLSGGESDLSTRRNAFLMLYNNAQAGPYTLPVFYKASGALRGKPGGSLYP
jgi:hypothetical protein